jgi:hypothetical protein
MSVGPRGQKVISFRRGASATHVLVLPAVVSLLLLLLALPAFASGDTTVAPPTVEGSRVRTHTPRPKVRTHVPELDPFAAGSAAVLILGGTLVALGRRRREESAELSSASHAPRRR